MAAIYIAWAVMLWRASGDPAKHPLFIDFTIWATAAHALVMLIATPMQKGLVMTGVESVASCGGCDRGAKQSPFRNSRRGHAES